ncbi:hypothetical protein [Streptomyces sp. NBC_00829]|uniref:hypothetical protein n=1 Tax=Streptomyces sp. NBC_00829 TaxID=2903679 RepID=UPI002F90B75D|nr:hypothetical protein OG293_40105 [Streptomyces sp. NBC_00829]
MEESNAQRRAKHRARLNRLRTQAACHLRKWISRHGHTVRAEFLQGVAYKLGSGAVTLLILWWETRP